MVTTTQRFTGERRAIVERLFPAGIPALWCPPLTHFTEDGAIDRPRMRAHLRFMQPYVKGFLLPGSTGEGWALSDAETSELLELMLGEIGAIQGHLLVGALKATTGEMVASVGATLAWLARRTGTRDVMESTTRSPFRGFAVTPPRGASLTQQAIHSGLEEVAALGIPMALYQLPQMTQNEMSAETVAALAARHPRLYLLKDSSGGDRVAAAGVRELFLVRGAENDYARHLVGGGGRYDGILLSTANCFPRQLSVLLADLERGARPAAEAFSRTLTAIMAELLARAGRLGYGNPYANANKAMDHFFAHGPGAAAVAPPCIHGGRRLPRDLVEAAGAALRQHGLMPDRGYLDGEAAR